MKILNGILYVVVAIMLVLVPWYIYEDQMDIDDKIRYYGNVTVKPTFNFPEQIESISFGWAAYDEPFPIDFINELWCAPIDSGKKKELVKVRYKSFDSYSFGNELPADVQNIVDEEIRPTHQLSVLARRSIRTRHAEEPYFTWVLDDIRPFESSDCFINATVIQYTPRFKIRKEIKFDGHEFQYIIPEDQEYKDSLN